MARTRPGSTELARLLDSAVEPVYVLDEEQRIVFCNRACLNWVGRKAEELLGRRSTYPSGPEGAREDAGAAGLCPQPAALAGRETVGVVGCSLADGRLSRRRARFVPVRGEEGAPAGLLVLVEPGELSEADALAALPKDDEAARLHERIRTFRHQMAGRYRIDRLVGDSPAMRKARAQVELAASGRGSVLVVGPPGSGRQHVAAAIHYAAGPEAAGPLVPLACPLLDADLIRSTLAALVARYSPSDGGPRGSVLLSDVERISPEAQADLARLFHSRPFPLRILATARRPLSETAGQGAYREDLAAMLSTLVIELPPLERRRRDLPLLAQLSLEEASATSGKQLAGFTAEAMDCLDAYGWPGNLDELVQVVREAHQRAEGTEVGAGDLPQFIHLALRAAAHPRRPEETIALDEFLRRVERELLQRAMARAKGNKTKAARLLGMTRPRLYRRLIQLGLEEKEDQDDVSGAPDA